MEIVRKDTSITDYSAVAIGEVFVRIKDNDVYMETEEGPIGLGDGCCYIIEDDEEVQVVKAKLYIED